MIPLNTREKKQVQLYQCIPRVLYILLNHRASKLNRKCSEPVATERALFLQLSFLALTPETFCSSSQIPHIYIEKAPESYKFPIRSRRNEEREGCSTGFSNIQMICTWYIFPFHDRPFPIRSMNMIRIRLIAGVRGTTKGHFGPYNFRETNFNNTDC